MTSDAEIVERLNFENNEIEHELGWAKAELTRLSARVEELEQFIRKVRDFYFDHQNIIPPPCAPDADHSGPTSTWGSGSHFERLSRSLLSPSTNLKE